MAKKKTDEKIREDEFMKFIGGDPARAALVISYEQVRQLRQQIGVIKLTLLVIETHLAAIRSFHEQEHEEVAQKESAVEQIYGAFADENGETGAAGSDTVSDGGGEGN